MMNKTLICTVGLPLSGKTTWARDQGFPIVNPDSVRLAIHGLRFEPLTEPLVWAITKIMVRALFTAGHDKVIVDACNTSRKRRDNWQSNDWDTQFVVIDTPRRGCIHRAQEKNDEEIIPSINRMAENWDSLAASEWEFGKERPGSP